jgi:hypothetical protein
MTTILLPDTTTLMLRGGPGTATHNNSNIRQVGKYVSADIRATWNIFTCWHVKNIVIYLYRK